MVRPPYPVAVRLCIYAAERWPEIDAAYYMLPAGALLRERPHRFLNFVYAWVIERVPQDRLDDWKAELEELLPWQDADSAAAEDIESASFFGMMNKQ